MAWKCTQLLREENKNYKLYNWPIFWRKTLAHAVSVLKIIITALITLKKVYNMCKKGYLRNFLGS